MRPEQREDLLYTEGKKTTVAFEEELLFGEMERLLPHGSSIVDVGCGSGEVGLAIAGQGFAVVGFDFSPAAVQAARVNGLDAREADLDDRGIPLEDGSMDAVYAGDVVEHVFDPAFLHREFTRVLRPGGYAFVSVPHDANAVAAYRALRMDSPQRTTYERLGQCKHHSFISVPLMKHFAVAAGLSLERLVLLGRAWGPLRVWSDWQFRSSSWSVPLWQRVVSNRLCIVLQKRSDECRADES